MERTVLTISAANFITVNLMVAVMVIFLVMISRFVKGRADD